MAFTNTTLSISPLLETTFISDMRIIVNSNVTVLKSKVEDLINTLQIDLVNKYIGTDLPLGKLYTQDLIVSNKMELKNGVGPAAATTASLTQASGISTFLADNLQFRRDLTANAQASKAAIKTAVIGGTSGGTPLLFPTSGGAGLPDPGLYVGDANTPVFAGFYGNAKFEKRAISQSVSTPRLIQLTDQGGSYFHGIISLARTDEQFILVNLKLPGVSMPVGGSPIYLTLHDSFATENARPYVGQSFTILINSIRYSNDQEIPAANRPSVTGPTATTGGISILPGWQISASSGPDSYKIGHINSTIWPSTPASNVAAVAAALGSGLTNRTLIRFYNANIQGDTSIPDLLGSCVTLTKIAEETTLSRYVITGGSNYIIVNAN